MKHGKNLSSPCVKNRFFIFLFFLLTWLYPKNFILASLISRCGFSSLLKSLFSVTLPWGGKNHSRRKTIIFIIEHKMFVLFLFGIFKKIFSNDSIIWWSKKVPRAQCRLEADDPWSDMETKAIGRVRLREKGIYHEIAKELIQIWLRYTWPFELIFSAVAIKSKLTKNGDEPC